MKLAKNILKGIKDLIKPTSQEIECAIDQNIVDCKGPEFNYTGVPAPVISPSDDWFNEPILTDKMQDYMIQETEIKQQDQNNESEDIHQLMYEIAISSGKTTLQLDPTDSWNSGIGS